MVGWGKGRVVQTITSSLRGCGGMRIYCPRSAQPQYISRYVVRSQFTKGRHIPYVMLIVTTYTTLMLRCALLRRLMGALMGALAKKELRNLLAKGGCVGRRPPRYLPDWVKKLDVPL